jgi:hypothetical protein
MSTNFAPDVWKPTTHHNEKWFVKTDEKSPQFQLSPAQQTIREETLLQNHCKTTSSYPSLSHNELKEKLHRFSTACNNLMDSSQ